MRLTKTIFTVLFTLVWLINGLYCKVLNGVPRHRQIVARILGAPHVASLTTLIGLAEIGMAVWIISGIKPRWCDWCQIGVVLLMNLIEFTLTPDLLLFGRINLLVALVFVTVVYLADRIPAKTYLPSF
ncbi:DoxX-like family protein [Fibrella sp. HMF5335]|uniref:DoxX-like family protein n=1 Tax=Fibrella rubiginis TaxID=2817060 RepID=A0A939GME5_9BACT|nr:DoxX-like family protein [Fibrella rubiginis]MBO0939456.1 DoxX-like family protein [Fibrella rubiginis]